MIYEESVQNQLLTDRYEGHIEAAYSYETAFSEKTHYNGSIRVPFGDKVQSFIYGSL